MTDDLISLLANGRRLIPGSARARRIALLFRYEQPRMKFMLWALSAVFVAVVFLRLGDDPFPVLLAGFMWAMSSNGIRTQLERITGAEDHSMTLPVSREELFWVQFLPGAAGCVALSAFVLLANAMELSPTLWSLISDGPLAAPVPAWSSLATVAVSLLPLFIHTVYFLFYALRLPTAVMAILPALGMMPVVFSSIMIQANPAFTRLPVSGVATIAGLLILGMTLWARHAFLNMQIMPGNKDGGTRAKARRVKAPTAITTHTPVAESPIRTSAEQFVPYPREYFSETSSRRRALFLHTYARRKTWLKWGFALCAGLAFVVPAQGLWLVQSIAGVAFTLLIYTGWSRGVEGEEYSLLLPASRHELFLVRVVPVVGALMALAAWSFLVGVVLNVPFRVWGNFPQTDAKSVVALFLAPTVTVSLTAVLPMGAPRVASFLWLGFLFLQFGPIGFLFKSDAMELAGVLLALTAGSLMWSYRSFLTKEVTPPVVGMWGTKAK